MNTIDIRNNGKVLPIERIIFAEDGEYSTPDFITNEAGTLYLGNNGDEYISELQPDVAADLLKALLKAQELGWIPKPVAEVPKAPVARKPAAAAKK